MSRLIRKQIERLRRFQRRSVRNVKRFFAAIVRPIERLGRRISRILVSGADRADRVGDLASACLRAASAPFRMAWASCQKLVAALLPASVRWAIATSFRRAAHTARNIGRYLVKLGLALNLDRVILPLVRVTRPIWRPIWLSACSLSRFLAAWSTTRRYKRLLWAMPAIALILPIGLMTGRSLAFGSGKTAQFYQIARRQAYEKQDFELVQFYERKLAQLGANNNRRDFSIAQQYADDGRLEEAYQRMQQLAPRDEPGYAEAHYWIVRQLLSNALDVDEQDRLELVGIHLDHLAALGIDVPAIQYYRAVWRRESGRLEDAVECLKPIRDEMAAAASLRLYLNRTADNQAEAREDALAVRRHMEINQRRQELTSYDYSSWRLAEETLDNPDGVRSVLESWVAAEPDNKEARNLLSEIRRRQYEQTISRGRPSPDRLIQLLTSAANASEDPREMLPHVALLFQQRDSNPLAASMIEQLLGSDDTPASFLEAMGTLAAVGGDWELGSELVNRALEKDPSNAVAWNNWGWMLLSQSDQGEPHNAKLDEALVAVQKAIDLEPENFYFRETRGQILLRMGRYEQAVADLEYAANGLPGLPEIHQSLAKAHQALGNSELAEMHAQYGQ